MPPRGPFTEPRAGRGGFVFAAGLVRAPPRRPGRSRADSSRPGRGERWFRPWGARPGPGRARRGVRAARWLPPNARSLWSRLLPHVSSAAATFRVIELVKPVVPFLPDIKSPPAGKPVSSRAPAARPGRQRAAAARAIARSARRAALQPGATPPWRPRTALPRPAAAARSAVVRRVCWCGPVARPHSPASGKGGGGRALPRWAGLRSRPSRPAPRGPSCGRSPFRASPSHTVPPRSSPRLAAAAPAPEAVPTLAGLSRPVDHTRCGPFPRP